jgi:NADPH:quinone reductase-like Zn-dependent oxidoreductase
MQDAASLPLVALTTIQGLRDRASAQPGQSILIHAGSGGLGSFAIQYAKGVLNLQVTTTTSSRNRDWVQQLGADNVIAYDQSNYLQCGQRFDLVFDTLGPPHTARSFEVVKQGGAVVSVVGPPDANFAKQVGAGFPMNLVISAVSLPMRFRAHRAKARYFRYLTESSGTQLRELNQQLKHGLIKPVIDRVFPLTECREALDYLARGRARGKVVISIGNAPKDNTRANKSAAANRRPAGQSDGSGNLSAIVAADRAFPAAVAELGR